MSTPTHPAVELSEETAAKVRILADLAVSKAAIEAQERELRAALRAELPARGSYTINGVPAVSLAPTRRFNQDRAKEVLPAGTYDLICVQVADSRKAKELLPPALYELCQAEGPNDTVRLT